MRSLHPLTTPRATSGWLWAGILVLLLAACGTLEGQPPVAEPPTGPVAAGSDHDIIATVDISHSDSQSAIAAAYGGDVIVWRPDAGFAILGIAEPADAIGTLGRPDDRPGARPTRPRPANAAPNRDAFSVPQFDDAAALSVNAWAGGVSAWAGGVNAWAGGVNAWAGGVENPFPGNESLWGQIRLGQAQDATVNLGQGITVAIIDTGLDLHHVAFSGRLAPSGDWLDLVDGDAHPHEGFVEACLRWDGSICAEWGTVRTGQGVFFGHGTAVAGVVLQAAPNATLLPIRVLNSYGFGSATDVAVAIDHAIARGADVINLSLGTFERVEAIDRMLAYAGQLGIVVVAASGNTGTSHVMYPAATAAGPGFPHALSVGSVDVNDEKSWFSTYGLLEVLAPSEGVGTLYPGDAMAYAIGTSFSAAWVSGTVALILGDGGSVDHVSTDILHTSTDIDALNPGFAGLLGHGRLEASEAVRVALGGPFVGEVCPVSGPIGGIDIGGISEYLFVFTDGRSDANWQSASKGYVGNVAVNGLLAKERTSGTFGYAGTIFTNDTTLSAWQKIIDSNSSQSSARFNETARLAALEAELKARMVEINGLPVTPGFESRSATSLAGDYSTRPETRFVINVTSGLNVSSQINITGRADQVFILRWDEDANPSNGYQGQVKFQSGGAIIPLGGLKPSNFIHVAGDMNASGGGSNPPAPYPQGPRYDDGTGALISGGSDFSGGGFFTGYWLTTGTPSTFDSATGLWFGETASFSNAIFVGGWYSITDKFSMTSGTSAVHVCPNPQTIRR
jgi:hypothetical protein